MDHCTWPMDTSLTNNLPPNNSQANFKHTHRHTHRGIRHRKCM